MPDQDILVEETVTVEESLQFTTPPPAVYQECKDEIFALRDKIMQDLVAGRVKAILNAGHDSMEKYRERVDKLGITTYLFGDLRRKAMVIRLKGYDLGEGAYRYAKTEYDTPQANYPLTQPYKVPQRSLPQVDVFSYTTRTDVDITEISNAMQLQGLICIQVPNNWALQPPDAENALYDYYFLYPTKQVQSKITPEGLLHGLNYFTGLRTEFIRALTPTSIGSGYYLFSIFVWLDSLATLAVEGDKPTEVMARFFRSSETALNVTFTLGRYRVNDSDEGFWMTMQGIIPSLGWYKVGSVNYAETGAQETWRNHFTLTMEVNDPVMGYVDPSVGDHVIKADQNVTCTAYPNIGYHFVRWQLDGINWVELNPVTSLQPSWKNSKVKAIFAHD